MAPWSGNRIVAALGKRVATRDARGAHPASPEPAIALDRLVRVVRARRVVAARRGQDLRERHLVATDQRQEHPRHAFMLASLSAACEASALSSANDTVSAAGRAIRTTSYRIPTSRSGESAPKSSARDTSLSRRRARLRSTDDLTARLTVTPTRPSPASLGTANPTRARPLKNLRPF